MIIVSSLHKSFGIQHVLKDVSFQIERGSFTGLIGPSGSGKSVLLKILGGVYLPSRGSVELRAGGEVSLMFQEGALFDSLSVYDNIAFPLTNGKVPVTLLSRSALSEVHEKVCDILERVGLLEARYKLPSQLSGGMRRRVSLARALVVRPQLMLLDDPTCGLDPVTSSVIMDLIGEIHQEYGTTTVVVSHDLRRLLPVCDELIALFGGNLVFKGGISELVDVGQAVVKNFVSCRYDLEARPQ